MAKINIKNIIEGLEGDDVEVVRSRFKIGDKILVLVGSYDEDLIDKAFNAESVIEPQDD